MKIGIDVDGVLTDMYSYQVNKGSKYFWEKYKIGLSDPKGYEISDIFAVNKTKDNEFWLDHIYDYGVNSKPRDYAKEIIDKLHEEGNYILIMTARGGDNENTLPQEETQEMVKSWLIANNIYYDEIVFSVEDKVNTCRELKLDVMIEDKPRNVEMISKALPVICFDNLYNHHLHGTNIYRAYSWYDVYIKLLGLKSNIKKQ